MAGTAASCMNKINIAEPTEHKAFIYNSLSTQTVSILLL